MEKYIEAEMEIVEFESEDIIAGSGCTVVTMPIGCTSDKPTCSSNCPFDGMCMEAE